MADELWKTLMQFHREVLAPDMERVAEEHFDRRIAPFQERMLSGYDQLSSELRTLRIEYEFIKVALKRLEDRVTLLEQSVASIDRKLEALALTSELQELKARVTVIEQRLAELNAS